MTPYEELDELLHSLFSSEQLRALVLALPDGDDVRRDLPSSPASPAELATATIQALGNRGLLTEPEPFWLRVVRRRPWRCRWIKRVARRWGCDLDLVTLARGVAPWTAIPLLPLVMLGAIMSDDCGARKETPPPPACGNGSVERGEDCDRGSENSVQSACTAECRKAVCGDGRRWSVDGGQEECDDGSGNGPGKLCNAQCKLNVCGDGDRGPAEKCDDGSGNGLGKACSAQCKLNVCGDGDRGPAEECDDGSENGAGKSCNEQCKLETCGDGSRGPAEECDNGSENGAGKICNALCKLNICGDGDRASAEECDDGNKIEDDSCTNKCTVVMGLPRIGPCDVTTTREMKSDHDAIKKCAAGMTKGYLEATGSIRPDGPWHGDVSIRVCYLPDESCPFVDFLEVKKDAPITQDTKITLQSKTLNFSPNQKLRIHIGRNGDRLSFLPGFRYRLKEGESPRGDK